MSRRRGTSARAERKPVVVVAGEDANDRDALCEILPALRPEMQGRLVQISDPVRLRKATGQKLEERAHTVVRKAKARATRERAELAGLVVHEDLDGVTGPEYTRVRRSVVDALGKHTGGACCLALAAWETEAWLLLFPDALEAHRKGWWVPPARRGKDTGRLANPKEVLMAELGSPRYRVGDAPDVVKKAAELGLLDRPVGRNESFNDFVEDAHDLADTIGAPVRSRPGSPGQEKK